MKCLKCGSDNIEWLEIVHSCKDCDVWLVACKDCNNEQLEIEWKSYK